MKRIFAISLLFIILLASCSQTEKATPTPEPGVLSLDKERQLPCLQLVDGLCVVSEPGEYLGEGETIIINQRPDAEFIGHGTALQIKVEDWTLIFDPGEGHAFSVGMSFPSAKLYPQGEKTGMSIERGGKKCSKVEGLFADTIMRSEMDGNQQINPIIAFDIRFSMRCDGADRVIFGRVKQKITE